MYRMIGAAVVGLFAVAVADAHFPFVVPDDKGESAKVVFSDNLEPDTNVNIEKIANTKLTLRDSNGKDSPLEWKKGDGRLEAWIFEGKDRYGVKYLEVERIGD